MAGWKTEQILGTMPGMLDLAAAAGADLAQTADIVSDNMTAMGVPVKDAPHFMDVYAYALTNSNARLTDFGETMKYAAPVAKSFGASLDETAAMVMMMANAGIKGSMAGTSLRMGLLRLAGPPKTATKAMKDLGLSLSDAQAGALEAEAVIKGLGIDLSGAVTPGEKMTRVLMQLHEKTKNLSQDEKLAAFKGIFGVNAETGWLALMDQGPEVFLKYVEGLRNADGYSKTIANEMLDNTQGAMIILSSAWESVSLSIGQALTPAVRSAAEAIVPLVSSFAQWAGQHPQIIQGVVGIIAALSGLALAVTGVAVAFATWGVITSQIAMFRAGMAAMQAGMVASEIAAMGFAARAGAAFASLRAAIAGLTFSSAIAGIGSAFTTVATAIRTATMAAWGFIATPIGAALAAIAIAAYLVYENWDRLAPVFENIASTFMNSLASIEPAISAAIASIQNAFSALDGMNIGDTLIKGILVIVNVAASVAATLVNIFAQAIITIADLFKNLGDVVKNVLEGDFVEAGKSAANLVTDALTDTVDTVKALKTLGDLPENIQRSNEIFDEQTRLKEIEQRGSAGERLNSVSIPQSASERFQSVVNSPKDYSNVTTTLNAQRKSAKRDAIYSKTFDRLGLDYQNYKAAQSAGEYQQQVPAYTNQVDVSKIVESINAARQTPQPQPVQQAAQPATPQPTPTPTPQTTPQVQPVVKVETPKPAETSQPQTPQSTDLNSQLQSQQRILNSQQAYQNLLLQQATTWQKTQPQAKVETPKPAEQPTPQPTPQPTTPQPAEQQKPVDTQAVQEGFNQAAQSANQFAQATKPAAEAQQQFPQAAQEVQTALQGVSQSFQPVQAAIGQVGTAAGETSGAVGQLGTAANEASGAVGQLGTVSSEAAGAVGQLGTAASEAAGAVGQLGTAAAGASGAVGQLGTASAGAAGAVGFLGTAAQSAASALSAAASSIASAAASAASAAASASAAAASAGGGAKANYRGGIYGKGAFLTWFAEKSPEAAIPLDKSARAINLWTQAGQMLGVLPNDSNSPISTTKPSADSTKRGLLNFERTKNKRANQIYNSIVNQQNSQTYSTSTFFDSTISRMASTISNISDVQNSVQNLQAAQFDELGNIIGLNGAAGNVITKYDNDKIKQVKQAAQLKEFQRRQAQLDKSNDFFASARKLFKEQFKPIRTASSAEKKLPTPIILTEQQRYRSEDVAKEKTLERVANSRSYKAIQNSMGRSQAAKSTSILNQGDLKTSIPTDLTGGLFGRLGLGNINLDGIFGVDLGNIFGGLFGNIFGKPDVTNVDITHPVPTFPTQQQNSQPIIDSPILTTIQKTNSIVERQPVMTTPQTARKNSGSILDRGELNTKLPTDITGGLFSKLGLGNINLGGIMGVDLANILGGLFGNIFGGGQSKFLKTSPAETIMNFAQSLAAPILETLSPANSIEPLGSVQSETPSNGFSSIFQPTFNITVTVNASGGDVDAKGIGERIAFSARESFETEFQRFMHEKTRRGFV